MGKILCELTFVTGALAGLFMGGFLKTGQNVGLISIFSLLLASFKNSLSDPISLLKNPKSLFGIIGIALTLIDIIFIIFTGLVGMISALFGFVGMLLLVTTNQQAIGVVLLILGGTLALFGPDNQSHSRLY
jgi:hypothetical protein